MILDVSFRVLGHEIPLDHSYALYSSLSRQLPSLHGAEWLGIHRITGLQIDGKRLRLTPDSRLRLRLPSEYLPSVMPLAGCTVKLFYKFMGFLIFFGFFFIFFFL